MHYPKWKYHKTESAIIVHTKEDDLALGDSWAESPAHFDLDDVDLTADIVEPVAQEAIEEPANKAKPKQKKKIEPEVQT